MKITATIEGYFTEEQAKKIKEKMQGKTYLKFNVDYSNEAGNCAIVVTTDNYDENEYDTPYEFRQALREDFMYYTISEMI